MVAAVVLKPKVWFPVRRPLLAGCLALVISSCSTPVDEVAGGGSLHPEVLSISSVAGSPSTGGSAEPARWQVTTSTNFRLFHLHIGSSLAWRVVDAAEADREEQLRLWDGLSPSTSWSPKCSVYLYPSNTTLLQMTGRQRKAGSAVNRPSVLRPGGMIDRRINIAADDANILRCTLPHEIAHIILADKLHGRKAPLWSDEGLAVLAEHPSCQRHAMAHLAQYLARGQAYPVMVLMQMKHYPADELKFLFYAQSASLTRFLLEQGTRRQFVQFLRWAKPGSIESALRQVYLLDGFSDLEQRWRTLVQTHP